MEFESEYSLIKTSETVNLIVVGTICIISFFVASKEVAFGVIFGSALSIANIRFIRLVAYRLLQKGKKVAWFFWAVSLGKFYILAGLLFLGLVVLKINALGLMIGFAFPLLTIAIVGIIFYRQTESSV